MSDVLEDEAEPTVSIQEYLEGVEEQELEADLVLGGDDGKECTYNKGYMKRQAIFSCLTCTPDGNAGVCTACSLSCHDGHEILELWTKRHFRCDCGNSKFGELYCKLFANKDVENAENGYNHNFKGAYCTCGRPYPDPEAEEQVEMIQCCICEDWFHEEHIGLEARNEVPRDEEGDPLYEDFICQGCSGACSFLTLYPQTTLETAKQQDATKDNPTSETKGKEVVEDATLACGSSENLENVTYSSKKTAKVCDDVAAASSHLKQCTNAADPSTECTVGVDLNVAPPPVLEKSKPIFLPKNWRDVICKCKNCVKFYEEKRIGFLVDKDDSIAEYEKIAKRKREEKLEQQEGVELNFLDKLGHVQKIEILSGIADMKNEIHSFLESYDPSKPVTTEDIHQVFENLAKKRRRT